MLYLQNDIMLHSDIRLVSGKPKTERNNGLILAKQGDYHILVCFILNIKVLFKLFSKLSKKNCPSSFSLLLYLLIEHLTLKQNLKYVKCYYK